MVRWIVKGVDLNHFNAVGGPVIPRCSAATAQVPGIVCSNGPIAATIGALFAAPAFAQTGPPPKPELTAIAESDTFQAGQPVRLAVRVSVPPGFHLQSNKPRDPLLIPTVLSIDAPAGV